LQAPSKISCCFGWLLPMWWMLAGVSSDQPWCFLCSSYLNSQVLCGTFLSLGDGGTFDALTLAPFVASGFPVSDLISVSSGCFTPCLWDHMVEDTTLGATIDASFHSYQEEEAGMWSSWPIHVWVATSSLQWGSEVKRSNRLDMSCSKPWGSSSCLRYLLCPPPLTVMNHPQAMKQLLYIQKGVRVTINEEKVKSNLGNHTLKWFGIYWQRNWSLLRRIDGCVTWLRWLCSWRLWECLSTCC
jgi:hypothetical protein